MIYQGLGTLFTGIVLLSINAKVYFEIYTRLTYFDFMRANILNHSVPLLLVVVGLLIIIFRNNKHK